MTRLAEPHGQMMTGPLHTPSNTYSTPFEPYSGSCSILDSTKSCETPTPIYDSDLLRHANDMPICFCLPLSCSRPSTVLPPAINAVPPSLSAGRACVACVNSGYTATQGNQNPQTHVHFKFQHHRAQAKQHSALILCIKLPTVLQRLKKDLNHILGTVANFKTLLWLRIRLCLHKSHQSFG